MNDKPSGSGLWIYLHFPLLPLEMLCTEADPGPVVLLDERRARLWLCNSQAEDKGLRPGMATATACSLCPQLTILPRQLQRETEQLEALAIQAGRFSAHISLQPNDGLLLEVASMLDYFGGFSLLCQQLNGELERLGFSCHIASGHTPLSARLLARSGGFIADSKARHLQQLQQLPVEALELDNRTTERLTGMGLFRLQQLLTLPRDELASRLGPQLLVIIDRLTGHQPDPPHYFTPPQNFCRRLELLHEIESSQALLFPLRRLLAELEGFLQSRQLQAITLELNLTGRQPLHTTAEQHPLCIRLTHSQGEHRSEAWLELWRLRLERLELQQPVIALQLAASRFRNRGDGAQDLFAPQQLQESPELLLSRLQTRLGADCIHHLSLKADHRPEQSWQRLQPEQRMLQPTASEQRQLLREARRRIRPGWLLERPRKLPADQIRQQLIRLLRGPERIVTGWWDDQPVRRDYYTARWPDGRLGWLYRDDRGHWYLHGWFG